MRRFWGFALALALLTGCAPPPQLPSKPVTRMVPAYPRSFAASAAASSGAQPYDAAQLDPRVTQSTVGSTIAVRGYTDGVRPPESITGRIKLSLMSQYHYGDPPSAYELDHFIPLELGGSSDLANLWLEPIAEARRKDTDENRAHDRVVSGAWTLAQGQQYIRDRWRIHYTQAVESTVAFPAAAKGDASTASIVATVSDSSPPQDAAVTVWAKVTDAAGRPLPGVRVGFIWRFKTVTRTDWVATGADGIAADTRGIGRATKGYAVRVDVTASAGADVGCSTSFVTR